MRNICLLLLLACLFNPIKNVAQTPQYRIFLVGDAGDDEMTNQTLDSLRSHLVRSPNSAVFFLGDNSYRNALWGLLPFGAKGFDSSLNTQNKVRAQLDILNTYKGSAYFVPGNHDWWNIMSIERGKPKVKMEESFIEKNLAKNTSIQNPDNTYIPKNGTPGPACVELDKGKIKVISIDSYWLILAGFKRNASKVADAENAFYHNLDSVLADAWSRKQKIMIVAHHPVYSKGFVMKPVYKLVPKRARQSVPDFPMYKRMSDKINAILKKYPGSYYAAGHIHAMQYFHTGYNLYYIISGAGSKLHHISKEDAAKSQTGNEKDGIFWNEKGFFELDFYEGAGEKLIIYYDEGKKKSAL